MLASCVQPVSPGKQELNILLKKKIHSRDTFCYCNLLCCLFQYLEHIVKLAEKKMKENLDRISR